MRALGRSRRWFAAALFAISAFGLPQASMAQAPPLKATLLMPNAPPGPIPVFPPGTPVTIIIRVEQATSPAVPVITTEGFSNIPFWRRLLFTDPQGGLVTDTTEAAFHRPDPVLACFLPGASQAIPVVPAEVLPADFVREYEIDARVRYDLSRTGLYTVTFQSPLKTFDTVLSNCANLGPVVDVGAPPDVRNDFTLKSNIRTFLISRYQVDGFQRPLINDSECPGPPCRTFRLGSTIAVKLQLSDENGVVGTAVVLIGVERIDATPPAQNPDDLGTGATDTGNRFRFDPSSNQYVFNLDTKVLAAGTWRIDACLDDGTCRSVHIGLR